MVFTYRTYVHRVLVHLSPDLCGGLASHPSNMFGNKQPATAQLKNVSRNRSGDRKARTGGTGMTAARQSRKDPSSSMGSKKPRHCSRFISSQIHHVDKAANIIYPQSYIKQPLCIATWNTRSLVSDSSKLFQLATNIDDYRLDVLGLTETHMPGVGTEILNNGSLLLFSGRTDNIKRQGVGIVLS